jgi:hypothetical protein
MPVDACQFFYGCKGCGGDAASERRGLLRLLLLRFGPMPADPGRAEQRSIEKLLRGQVARHRNYIC